jgi:hypothetical protein
MTDYPPHVQDLGDVLYDLDDRDIAYPVRPARERFRDTAARIIRGLAARGYAVVRVQDSVPSQEQEELRELRHTVLSQDIALAQLREDHRRMTVLAQRQILENTDQRKMLKEWHDKCDEVGVPHDPDTLILHHRMMALNLRYTLPPYEPQHMAPSHDVDPELQRLLDEEDEIERQVNPPRHLKPDPLLPLLTKMRDPLDQVLPPYSPSDPLADLFERMPYT